MKTGCGINLLLRRGWGATLTIEKRAQGVFCREGGKGGVTPGES